MDSLCPHCGNTNQSGERSVQCQTCRHWYHMPLPDAPETLLQCELCGKRVSAYTDPARRLCYICTVPKV